ncbi:MAG TPA: PSD1 and planctomycete cytochrome C domain-containing protein [Planctomycetaceae bacterium]|jgi:hypothetical protein|nr:PSD1 and planctomycete cytochrome C domain-containing protein [Planctomycetaceae bacterium]
MSVRGPIIDSPCRRVRLRAVLIPAIGLAVAWVPSLGLAAGPKRINYSRDIRPILSNTCYKCHGPDEKQRKAGLRLDKKEGAYARLESGEVAIVPGSSAKSAVWQRLTAKDPDVRMPPPDSGKTIAPEQIELIKRWIDEGAEFHGHWSLLPPQHAAAPPVQHPELARNPIDRFVLARLDEEGLAPSPQADKTTLIRRVTLDLTGLPPSLGDVDRFLADQSPNAYEKLVDRLLDSPQYGEQMTRYWLDAARYGDTHGMHLDNERSIWPYRDWLIRSFNSNLPFDRFTVEQLAGDLLPNPTLDQRVATGFSRCNVTTGEGGAIDEEFYCRYAVDRVATTGTVFLGLTLGCCVCHDHKFDPVTQRDFYQLFGYFGSLTERAMDGNALLPPPTLRLGPPTDEQKIKELKARIETLESTIKDKLAQYAEPAEKRPATQAAVTASATQTASGQTASGQTASGQTAGRGTASATPVDALSAALAAWEVDAAKDAAGLPRNVRRILAVPLAKRIARQRRSLREYFVQAVFSGTREVFTPLNQQLARSRKELAAAELTAPSTLVMQDMPKPRDVFVLLRGAYDRKGQKVEPNVPAAIGPRLPKDAPPNRLSLARWIVDPQNPLTARVTVNRFWQQYFGTGIVKTAEDFGAQGEWPTHPELLDWLATEFVGSGWDVKRLQRLIVTSATYRQSSHVSDALAQRDPENRLLARGPRFRLDAEAVRDTALSVSGLLCETIGGKSVKPYQPPGLWEAISYTSSNTARFAKDKGDALYRRTMYTFWKRTSPPPALITFDAPSREECTVRRGRTNTPLQALVLMNDEQYVEAARHLAAKMIHQGGSTPAERIAFAFRLATSRRPTPEEMGIFTRLYEEQKAAYANNVEAAERLIHVGDSPADFTVDARELAAWSLVANVILNLDETVTKG